MTRSVAFLTELLAAEVAVERPETKMNANVVLDVAQLSVFNVAHFASEELVVPACLVVEYPLPVD